MEANEPSLAGPIFSAHMRILRQIAGETTFARALSRLDPDVQLAVNTSAAIGWVPFTVIEAVVNAVADESGRTVEALQREMVFTTTKDVLSGMWKLLAKALSPELIVSRIGLLWSRTYHPGKIHAESPAPSTVIVRVSEFGTPSDYLLRGMSFTLEALLTELGRRAVRVKTERTADGAVLHVQWRS